MSAIHVVIQLVALLVAVCHGSSLPAEIFQYTHRNTSFTASVVDDQGLLYVAGSIQSGGYISDGSTSIVGGPLNFVAKFNQDMSLQWAHKIASVQTEDVTVMKVYDLAIVSSHACVYGRTSTVLDGTVGVGKLFVECLTLGGASVWFESFIPQLDLTELRGGLMSHNETHIFVPVVANGNFYTLESGSIDQLDEAATFNSFYFIYEFHAALSKFVFSERYQHTTKSQLIANTLDEKGELYVAGATDDDQTSLGPLNADGYVGPLQATTNGDVVVYSLRYYNGYFYLLVAVSDFETSMFGCTLDPQDQTLRLFVVKLSKESNSCSFFRAEQTDTGAFTNYRMEIYQDKIYISHIFLGPLFPTIYVISVDTLELDFYPFVRPQMLPGSGTSMAVDSSNDKIYWLVTLTNQIPETDNILLRGVDGEDFSVFSESAVIARYSTEAVQASSIDISMGQSSQIGSSVQDSSQQVTAEFTNSEISSSSINNHSAQVTDDTATDSSTTEIAKSSTMVGFSEPLPLVSQSANQLSPAYDSSAIDMNDATSQHPTYSSQLEHLESFALISELPVAESSNSYVPPTCIIFSAHSSYCGKFSITGFGSESVNSYTWTISSLTDRTKKPQVVAGINLSADFGSVDPGLYELKLECWDGISSAFGYFNISRVDFAMGEHCETKIEAIPSAFEPLEPGSIRIPTIDRMKRMAIKTKSIPGYVFNWNIVDNSRRVANSGCLSALCSFVTTSLSSSEGFVLDGTSTEEGMPSSKIFTIELNIIEERSGEIAFSRGFKLQTSSAEGVKLDPSSNGFEITAINYIPDANSLKQGIKGIALVSDFNLTAIIGTNGWQISPEDKITFIYSYFDAQRNIYVPLSTSTEGNIVTKLPSGYGSNGDLTLQLTLINEWGVSSHKSNTIRIGNVQTAVQSVESLVSLANSLDDIPSDTPEFASTAVTIATYINQNSASIVRDSTSQQQIEKIVDDLLSSIQVNEKNETSIQQQMVIVDVLTRTSRVVSYKSKTRALDIVQDVIRIRGQNNTQLSFNTFVQATRVLSNIGATKLSDQSIASKLFATTTELAKTLLAGKVASEKETAISTDNIDIFVKSEQSSDLNNAEFRSSNSTVIRIPSSFSTDLSSSEGSVISVTILVFKNNLFASKKDPASPVVDVTFLGQDQNALPVANLSTPLQIQMTKLSDNCQYVGKSAKYECMYFDEASSTWKGDGCFWEPNSDEFSAELNCFCNHTTSFSAFLLTKGKCPLKTPGLHISSIVVNAFYVALCVPLLICLFVTSRTQPVRSRFIAPFIGLFAIIVDAVLNGWIRSALLYSEKNNASDYFSYVIMLTSNPLSVVSLFVFLWQQIRFLLLQNLYYILSRKEKSGLQSNVMRISRVLTSKIAFISSSLLVGTAVFIYFLAMVLASAISKESARTTNTLISVQSISYMSMMIFLAVCIAITVLCDVILAYLRSKETVETFATSEQYIVSQQTKGLNVIYKSLRSKDVLHFRRESLFILVTISIMLVLFPVGISTVYREDRMSFIVVRQVLEFIFMLMSIISFGGYISIVGVFKSRQQSSKNVAQKIMEQGMHEEKHEAIDQAIVNVLSDPEGYKAFYKYCTLEFSLENLLLWKELEDLRTSNLVMSPHERKESLQHLERMYIARNSERELNLSNSDRQVFYRVSQIEQPNVAEAEEAFAKLFSVCMNNLGDTFTRLVSSEIYKNYIDAKSTAEELQEGMI